MANGKKAKFITTLLSVQVTLLNAASAIAAPPVDPVTKEITRAHLTFEKGDYKEALRISEKTIAAKPGSAMAHTIASLCYDALGNFNRAKSEALKAIELDPNYDLGYRALARYYLHTKVYKKCIEASQKSNSLYPTSDAYFLISSSLMRMGKTDESIQQARIGVKTTTLPEPHWQLVEMLVEAGRAHDAAIESLEAIRKHGAAKTNELVAMRVLDLEMREARKPDATDECKALMNKLAAALPKTPSLSSLSRDCFVLCNNFQGAKKFADIVVTMQPNSPDPYAARAQILFKAHHYKEAAADFRKVLEFRQNDRDALYEKAVCHLKIGETKNAIEFARKAVKQDPHSVRAWLLICNSLYLSGQREAALTTINEAIRMNPSNAECYLGRARIAQRAGHFERAMRDFNKVIVLGMHTNEVYMERASLAQELHQFDSALEDYKQVESNFANRRLRPQELVGLSELHFEKAKCFMADSKLADAVKELTTAIEINASEKSLLLRAQAYEKLGKLDLAENDKKMAKQIKANKGMKSKTQATSSKH